MGPRIWNSLPYGLKIIDSIEDFKGKLKNTFICHLLQLNSSQVKLSLLPLFYVFNF